MVSCPFSQVTSPVGPQGFTASSESWLWVFLWLWRPWNEASTFGESPPKNGFTNGSSKAYPLVNKHSNGKIHHF